MGTMESLGEAGSDAPAGEATDRAVHADCHTHERNCLNCAAPLIGDYCHSCGQRGHVHRTLGAFFHDLMHGVFHFEGKIWRTLPLLVWRPGALMRAYIEGRRASFVSPLALFLFTMFLMFAVVNSLSAPMEINAPSARDAMAADQAKNARDIERLTAERAMLVTAGGDLGRIDRKLKDAREEAALMKSIADRGFVRGTAMSVADAPDWLVAPLQHAADNPELLLYKVQNNAYKYSWALIPLSLPFMWLMFPFSRRFQLYDHVVFVTYSLSFMTLLVIAASILGAVGWSVAAGLLMIVPQLHIYRQLKTAYGLSGSSALWRTVLLTVFAIVAVAIFVSVLFALGIF